MFLKVAISVIGITVSLQQKLSMTVCSAIPHIKTLAVSHTEQFRVLSKATVTQSKTLNSRVVTSFWQHLATKSHSSQSTHAKCIL